MMHEDHISGPLVPVKRGYTLWFTGLSASGKSTISTDLGKKLVGHLDRQIYVIDGDYMRKTINRDLGYVQEERNLASERIAHVARILNDNGVICLVSNISQDNEIRRRVRDIIGDFVLVFVDTHIDECIKRDYKGHYKKALNGELKNFVGIDTPFEHPEDADILIDTSISEPSEASDAIIRFLRKEGKLDK